ncbi:MAG: bifunctional phosphopantothenoylcysteine decarboxylase/phosphopantothenate--cysteine ligase CoaBC [Thermodesulfovibrionales bacterium]
MLKNKHIILGVTGSIAAYKAIELTRRLTEAKAVVDVILTEAAKRFTTPLSFSSITKGRVFSDIFEDPLSHIRIAEEAELLLVAPATANIIGKMAHGIADDMLSTVYMAFNGKVMIAPAMNWRMYENPVLQRNLESLQSLGVIQIGPDRGSLACGEANIGRMAEVNAIIEEIEIALSEKDLEGKRLVITAGPTREYIDPIRFISNRSSGKMGYAIAKVAVRRGANVTLISGPSNLPPPRRVTFMSVETADEMKDAVMSNLKGSDALIMAAAVADFSPEQRSPEKISSREGLELRLRRTPDIIRSVRLAHEASVRSRPGGIEPIHIGFSAETGDNLERARQKRIEKGIDMIIFNDVTEAGAGFDVDTNRITIIERDKETEFPLMSKEDVAGVILDRLSEVLRGGIRQG